MMSVERTLKFQCLKGRIADPHSHDVPSLALLRAEKRDIC